MIILSYLETSLCLTKELQILQLPRRRIQSGSTRLNQQVGEVDGVDNQVDNGVGKIDEG